MQISSLFILGLLNLFPIWLLAEESKSATHGPDATPVTIPKNDLIIETRSFKEEDYNTGRSLRLAQSVSFRLSYTLYGLITSGKKGAHFLWHLENGNQIEFAHLRGEYAIKGFKVDIASFQERLNTIAYRQYLGNSFDFQYGIGRRTYSIKLGDDLVKYIEPIKDWEREMVRIESLVLQFGIGNTWSWKNGFSCGADWFALHYPIKTLDLKAPSGERIQNPPSRNAYEKMLAVAKRFPTISLLQLHLGWSF